jgi:hypothetical protein
VQLDRLKRVRKPRKIVAIITQYIHNRSITGRLGGVHSENGTVKSTVKQIKVFKMICQ